MLWRLTAAEAAKGVREGAFSAAELVRDCLSRIEETDGAIGAWAALDRDLALAQAEQKDEIRRQGRPTGALHGVPVAVKDLFDTKAWPTAWGAPYLAERRPEADAAVVSKLREAGAVILGKSVTTELAVGATVATRNPHNPDRTSGGSSAGSSAAVAAAQALLGVGTQTYGSIVRPASYCGVYGYKPTRGLVSRRGCLICSDTLDQVGVLGRTLEDMALLADALTGYDPADPWTNDLPKPRLVEGWRADPPVEPVFAVFDLPYADRFSDTLRQGFDAMIEALGDRVERLPAPPAFEAFLRGQDAVHGFEFINAVRENPDLDRARLSPELEVKLARAEGVAESQYREALDTMGAARSFFSAFFKDYDAVLTPSATGEALPMGQGTGDPICSVIWTFAGLPGLSLPWLSGAENMPLGVQLVGAEGEDDRLFRTARWLETRLAGAGDQQGDAA